jgi:Mrp family chromosome partitioning ATPase
MHKNKVSLENIAKNKSTEKNKIKHQVAIMSGKGGVGKSFVSSLIASYLSRKGYKVGLLDADITGPSIPKIFGLKDKRPSLQENSLIPVLTKSGIKIMSVNLLLPNEDEAVIWRGPLISNAILQFFNDVFWGELDYLLIDLPPGTSDASLTVLQNLTVDGVIMVFTPQELTNMIVKKAVNMVEKLGKKIVGLVENMSYFETPGSGEKINIFGASKLEEMKNLTNCKLSISIPLSPQFTEYVDKGNIEELEYQPFENFIENIEKLY